jgi:hypothetical protein
MWGEAMGYAVAVILIMGIVLLSMASLIKDNGKALNKDKQAKGRQVKEVIKERRYPYFYVKNCIFYPDEAAQFSYDESEYNFLKEKYEEFSKSLDYAQMLKICDEIIKIDWRSSKVWMDAINALFSDVLKNKYEWDESLSRKTVTYCYGYMQTFNNALDRSLEVKHNLIPAVMRRIKEVITYQKENFSELHNFEVYNMLINIYYMLPFRELLDCAYKYLLEDKITEDLNNTVYTQRSIRSILGHIEMLKAKYKTDITEEINPDENKGFSIDEYILVNDETFNTTFISFSINYPLGTNKVSIEFHFYDEQGKEIFLGRNNRIYIETFEIKNPISTKENFDIVIIGEDSIRSIELKLYKGNKDEVKDAEGQQENKSTASNSNTSEGNKSEASNTNPAQEKELKAELSKVGTAQVKVNKTEVPSNNIAKEKQNKEGTSNINAVKENKISGKTDNLNSAQNKANGELKKRDKTAEGLEFAKAAENSDEQNNEEEIFDTETTQGLKDEKNEEMLLFPSFKNVKEISLSELHFLALKNDGTVIGIGNDSKLTKVQNWSDIEKIYTTNFASYGIKKDGTLIITGKNEYDSLEHEYIWEGIKKIVPSYTHIIG